MHNAIRFLLMPEHLIRRFAAYLPTLDDCA